jgi:hypothetical protein
MTPEQDERLVSAFERIAEAFDFMAGSLDSIAKTQLKDYAKRYPAKQKNVKATVTHVKTEEERLKEDQGQTNESLEDWTTLTTEPPGPREKKWLEDHPESEKKV